MGDIYISNLSKTTLVIIFQLHLVIVVAPKAVISENRSQSKLGAVDDFCGFEGIRVTRLYPHVSQSYSLSSPLQSQKWRKLPCGDLLTLNLNSHHPSFRPTNHIPTTGGPISSIY